MSTRRTLRVVCLCLVGTLALQAAEQREYPCYQLAKAPALDGRIEPEAWANIPEAGGAYFLKADESLAQRPTYFRAGWTPDAIWLAVRCKEPALETLRTLAGKDGVIWEDDSVEFCCAAPRGARLQYIVNAAGTRWQARSHGEGWQTGVRKDKDEWTVEIKIPFANFMVTPGDREQWPFTIARNIPPSSTNCLGFKPGFCTVGNFDALLFLKQELKAEEVPGIEQKLAFQGAPVDMTFAAAMQSGVDGYKAGALSEAEKAHPYKSAAARDICGAKKNYAAAVVLATNEAQQAQALLQVGYCLYAGSGRTPGEHYSMPDRVYARSVYEQVVKMTNALPETLAQAQLYIAYCYYNVGEFRDIPAIKAAGEKALNMPGADLTVRLEALRMLSDADMMARNFASAKVWCAKTLEMKEADSHARERAEVRWRILDDWERMKKTPREVFNRDYRGEPIDSAAVNAMPSIGWAKPGWGQPMRALVMCYQDGIREVGELAQRMEMEPVIVTTADREHFGEKAPDSYAEGAVGFAVTAAKKVQDTFINALDQTNDVMILAGVNWSGMPLPVREKVLKKVAAGTPLIIKASQPDELLKAATTNRVPVGLAWVYPFQGLPAFAGYADKAAWEAGVVERSRHGKGDIWMLKGYEVPDYQILTPGPMGTEGDVKLVEYDYYLALMIHLIREAGGVKTPVRVKGQENWDMTREAMKSLLLQLASEIQTNVTCVWTVRDRENRISAVKQEPLALKPGENEIKYEMGKVSGGEYFVDLQVKDGDKVLDFGSAYVKVQSADRIESVELAKEIGKNEKVKGKVQLALSGKRDGLTLSIRRWDNYRREVGAEQVKVSGKEMKFVLPAAEPLTAIQMVDVELKQGEETLDRRRVSLRIKDFEEADRHAVWPQGAGAGSYLAEYLAAGYERAGVGKVRNNFVTELLNVSKFSLRQSSLLRPDRDYGGQAGQGMETFSFEHTRAGWIYMQAEVENPDQGLAWVWVGTGNDSRTMLNWAGGQDKGKQKETMRYLKPGQYRVYAGTQGKTRFSRLIVRSVPEIHYYRYPTDIPTDRARAKIDWEFLKKYVLSNVNVVVNLDLGRGEETMPPVKEALEWKERGGKWFADASVPAWHPDADIPTVAEVYQYWTGGALGMGYVDGLTPDEFTIAHLPKQQQKFEVYCQALRQISANPEYRGKQVYPFIGLGSARSYQSSLRHMAAIGYKLIAERYLGERENREQAARYIAQCYDLDMEPFLEVMAQPQQHLIHYFCPNTLGGFVVDVHPDADFKVFLDMQFNYLANAPACAGLYGVGPWSSLGSDEETLRWLGRLYRHYCIEGRRDMLSKDPYELAYIKNADFADGLRDWKTASAETDSIKPFVFPGLAHIEGRAYLGVFPGENECVAMRRSAKGPNCLAQTIANLEKGRMYSLAFYTYNDRNDDPGKLHAVAVKIDNAEILVPLSLQANMGKRNWHSIVFRASADSAVLTISDWKTAAEPGGKVGQELLYDFVQIQPYFSE